MVSITVKLVMIREMLVLPVKLATISIKENVSNVPITVKTVLQLLLVQVV